MTCIAPEGAGVVHSGVTGEGRPRTSSRIVFLIRQVRLMYELFVSEVETDEEVGQHEE